jgi:hypothetical protein
MSFSLTQRFQALADSYRATLAQIQDLRKFSTASYPTSDSDQQRAELSREIHEALKEQEDTLEILRQEVEDEAPLVRRGDRSPREAERDRNADLLARLTEDLKNARANFRRAQLQAKRTADSERRKEREQLFGERRQGDQAQARGRGTHEKLTQDELAVRAAEDVTIALRRVHNQLQGELSTSQFAQQTLQESQQALETLATSYSGTTDLLKASRGFVGQLVRSNKSDTWFLKTSFYLLAATLIWLVYRRLIYGPMMLFLVWPLKLMWWVTMRSMGVVGMGSGSSAASVSAPVPTLSVVQPQVGLGGIPQNEGGSQVFFKSMHLAAKGGGWAPEPASQMPQGDVEDKMIDRIGRMMENRPDQQDTEEEHLEKEAQPRDTKKRMMEVDVEPVRDEL